jgi:hypothetical protein
MILYHLSYAIPVCLLMFNGRRLPTPAWVPLGRFGWVANFVTVVWGLYALIFYCFPTSMSVPNSPYHHSSHTLIDTLRAVTQARQFEHDELCLGRPCRYIHICSGKLVRFCEEPLHNAAPGGRQRRRRGNELLPVIVGIYRASHYL